MAPAAHSWNVSGGRARSTTVEEKQANSKGMEHPRDDP